MPRGYAPSRVDENQKSIVKTFRNIGASVLLLHMVGKGCPDILVGYRGKNYLCELKSGEKSKLTPKEFEFFNDWDGQMCIIRSPENAIEFIEMVNDR